MPFPMASLYALSMPFPRALSPTPPRRTKLGRRAKLGRSTKLGSRASECHSDRLSRRHRYVKPERLAQVVVYSAGGRRKRDEPAKKEWRLEESAWKARAAWSDSGTFLDTEETYRKAFALDWSRALRSHGLAAYILKHAKGESKDEEKAEMRSEMEAGKGAGDDEAGNGARDDALLDELLAEQRRVKAEEAAARKISQSSEIAEIGEVLWKHHATIYRTFDAYSIISATPVRATPTRGLSLEATHSRPLTRGHTPTLSHSRPLTRDHSHSTLHPIAFDCQWLPVIAKVARRLAPRW